MGRDKGLAEYLAHRPLPGHGPQQPPLSRGDEAQKGVIGGGVLLYDVGQHTVYGVGRDVGRARFIEPVERHLHVPRVPGKPLVEPAEHAGQQPPPGIGQPGLDKGLVGSRDNALQIHHLRTLIERAGGRNKHVFQHVALAAGEDEAHRGEMLDVGTQQGLHLFVSISGDGLELVKGHIAAFARLLHVVEYLGQRPFGQVGLHVYRERGLPRHGVDGDDGAQRPEESGHPLHQPGLGGVERAQHSVAQLLDERGQTVRLVQVYIVARSLPGLFHLVEHVPDEPRFAHATGTDEGHIAAVSQGGGQLVCLLLTVAEIGRRHITGQQKGIDNVHKHKSSSRCEASLRTSRYELFAMQR